MDSHLKWFDLIFSLKIVFHLISSREPTSRSPLQPLGKRSQPQRGERALGWGHWSRAPSAGSQSEVQLRTFPRACLWESQRCTLPAVETSNRSGISFSSLLVEIRGEKWEDESASLNQNSSAALLTKHVCQPQACNVKWQRGMMNTLQICRP